MQWIRTKFVQISFLLCVQMMAGIPCFAAHHNLIDEHTLRHSLMIPMDENHSVTLAAGTPIDKISGEISQQRKGMGLLADIPPSEQEKLFQGPWKVSEHVEILAYPCTILQVYVEPGQQVKKGDLLYKYEAMKMTDTIKARRAGTIHTIFYKKDDHVKSVSLLMSLSTDWQDIDPKALDRLKPFFPWAAAPVVPVADIPVPVAPADPIVIEPAVADLAVHSKKLSSFMGIDPVHESREPETTSSNWMPAVGGITTKDRAPSDPLAPIDPTIDAPVVPIAVDVPAAVVGPIDSNGLKLPYSQLPSPPLVMLNSFQHPIDNKILKQVQDDNWEEDSRISSTQPSAPLVTQQTPGKLAKAQNSTVVHKAKEILQNNKVPAGAVALKSFHEGVEAYSESSFFIGSKWVLALLLLGQCLCMLKAGEITRSYMTALLATIKRRRAADFNSFFVENESLSNFNYPPQEYIKIYGGQRR